MKTHRHWQPHLSTPPLFNPFSGLTTLDHYDMVEEEEMDEISDEEQLADQASDPPPLMKRD